MKTTYQIKDWDANFENDRSRGREKCSFVCVPNKQHGMGFSRIMAEPDGGAIYGIWHLILGACSQQKKRNGWLTENGEKSGCAWDAEDLSVKFRRPIPEIQRALDFLASEKVGWIAIRSNTTNPNEINGKTNIPEVTADSPPTHHEVTADSPRIEEKRREENRREGKGETEEPRSHFPEIQVPNWDEVQAQCQTIGLVEWRARDWFNEMQQSGWKDNKGREVMDWKAYLTRVKTWWERDGRPMTPATKTAAGQPAPTVFSLTKIIEAKKVRADSLKAAHATETGLDTTWTDPRARDEWRTLRAEIKKLTIQLSKMA